MKIWLKKFLIPLTLIDKLTPSQGIIVDLGCGEGVICQYLAQKHSRQVIGVDLNLQKLKKIHQTSNLHFIHQDIIKFKPKNKITCCLLSDVLHHLNQQKQNLLLKKISHYLKVGGVFIIKEVDQRQLIRAWLTRFWDWFFYPRDKISYFSGKHLIAKLEKLNFSVTQIQTNRLFPGSVNLFIAHKHA